jgi:hypothetical protein
MEIYSENFGNIVKTSFEHDGKLHELILENVDGPFFSTKLFVESVKKFDFGFEGEN